MSVSASIGMVPKRGGSDYNRITLNPDGRNKAAPSGKKKHHYAPQAKDRVRFAPRPEQCGTVVDTYPNWSMVLWDGRTEPLRCDHERLAPVFQPAPEVEPTQPAPTKAGKPPLRLTNPERYQRLIDAQRKRRSAGLPKVCVDPIKHCEQCGVQFVRRRTKGKLEAPTAFAKRKYCSNSCAAASRVAPGLSKAVGV